MHILTIGSTKGGVGKSTIATNLAVISAQKGMRVILVDADIQKSSMDFRQLRAADNIQAISITTPTLHKDLSTFSKSCDLVIVDAGGRDNATFRSAILASSLFVVPVLPSVFDIYAVHEVLALLRECRALKDINARLLLNQLQAHTMMSRETEQTLAEMAEESDIPVLKTKLYYRSAYKNAIVTGNGVVEIDPKSKASSEISDLFSEVMSLLSKSGRKRGGK